MHLRFLVIMPLQMNEKENKAVARGSSNGVAVNGTLPGSGRGIPVLDEAHTQLVAALEPAISAWCPKELTILISEYTRRICFNCELLLQKWKQPVYKDKCERIRQLCMSYLSKCTKCKTCEEHRLHRREFGESNWKQVGREEGQKYLNGCGCWIRSTESVYRNPDRYDSDVCKKCLNRLLADSDGD